MVLEVRHLKKTFRHSWNFAKIPVLRGVSFSIKKPAIVGFLGVNGAGKTTTMKCITGLLNYQEGEIFIFGKNHMEREAKKSLGYMPEHPYFYGHLSAYEFLAFYAQLTHKLKGLELRKKVEFFLELVGLSSSRDKILRHFSKGMTQRIGIAQALIHSPGLLVLDEPLSGLDPDGRRDLVEIIKGVHNQGTSVFFSSHLLDDVDRLCNELVVIRQGEICFSGSKSEFMGQSQRDFLIRYQLGHKHREEKLETLFLLQKRIDELRAMEALVYSIEYEKVTLDQAFNSFQNFESQASGLSFLDQSLSRQVVSGGGV